MIWSSVKSFVCTALVSPALGPAGTVSTVAVCTSRNPPPRSWLPTCSIVSVLPR
jgi:hypothetical protein